MRFAADFEAGRRCVDSRTIRLVGITRSTEGSFMVGLFMRVRSSSAAAVASALIARIYGGDGEFASQSVVATTLLALATVPLWMLLI